MSDLSPIQWHIKAARSCTSQGSSPAQVFTGVVTNSTTRQLSDGLTTTFAGDKVSCYVCPVDETGLQAKAQRAAELAAHALGALYEQVLDWPEAATLVWQINEHTALEELHAQMIDALLGQGNSTVAEWCRNATVVTVTQPSDWAALADTEECLWLSTDSLLNSARLAHIDARVAHERWPDGLIPGEAASALWLSRKPDDALYPQLSIYPEQPAKLSRDTAPLRDIQPFEHLLVNSVSPELNTQSAWYQWVARHTTAPEMELEQHYWLARSFGYLGAATAGVGIHCALGGLNLPVPSNETAWLINQNLNNQYTIYQITQGEQHVR